MAFLDQAVDWANWADSSEVIAFLKPILKSLGKDELNCVRGILTRKRKRELKSKTPKPWRGPRLFTGCNNPPVRIPSSDVKTPEGSKPEEPMVLLKRPRMIEEHWAHAYNPEKFIAFDVEACSRFLKYLHDGNMHSLGDFPVPEGSLTYEDEPRIPKAAYLSMVDHKMRVILQKKIQHLPGTFKVDFFSKTTANITSTNQLMDGLPFHEVRERFREESKGKFHITCGGGNDYRYLEVSPVEFERFDLQSFYQRPAEDNPMKMEPMSLRDIYFYHFKKDFQRGPHNATIDAKATMKIFLEGYCKMDLNKDYDFSKTPKLKNMAKKGLFWCATENAFRRVCQCEGCLKVDL